MNMLIVVFTYLLTYIGRRQLPHAHWCRDKHITFNAGTDSVVKTERPTLFEWQGKQL